MKRARTFLTLAALMATLVLPGCTQGGGGGTSGPTPGGSSGEPATGTRLRIAMVTDQGGLGDQSFNDSAYAGLKKAAADLGIEPKVVESKETQDYIKNLNTVADDKFDLVVAVGIAMSDAVTEAATKHPNVKFAHVDGSETGLPNVETLTFNEEEGSYLAGALTGLMTKTNKVGFIGGREIPLILKFESGYDAGVETTNPKATIQRGYTNKWDDPGKGKEMAESQISQGVDIIFSPSGACVKGVIEAVKSKGAGYWAIGVDSDEDFLGTADPKNPAPPGRVLTSMVKHVDNAVYLCVKNLKEGHFTPGKTTYGLKEDGVGLSDMKYSKDQVPAGVLAQVDALKQEVIAGQIKVPSTLDEVKAFKPPAMPSPSAVSSGAPSASPDASTH